MPVAVAIRILEFTWPPATLSDFRQSIRSFSNSSPKSVFLPRFGALGPALSACSSVDCSGVMVPSSVLNCKDIDIQTLLVESFESSYS